MSKPWRDSQTLKHIPYKEDMNTVGTARYTSLNSHLGVEQGRRDDLESFGYCMIYWLKGSLWKIF